jgi:hypothetical protein
MCAILNRVKNHKYVGASIQLETILNIIHAGKAE